MQRPPNFDTPEQQSAWRQWVTDSIVWIQDQVRHLHECIEKRTGETKELVAAKASAAEELAESRHGQNLETLKRIEDTVQLLTSFRENATQKEIEHQAVASERRRLADEKARRRAALQDTAWKLGEKALGAGVLTLALAGLYSVARAIGL